MFICLPACIIFIGALNNNEESVLAKVGNKVISLNEFLMRAEYTLRPSYCRNNSNIDKKIILNSLIAEKLLVIEAEKNNSFKDKIEAQTYLLGRKEQTMRLYLYNEKVKKKVVLDTNKINKVFKYAGREYNIAYVTLKDSLVVEQLKDEIINRKLSFDSVLHDNYSLKKIPEKKVVWSDLESPLILDLLFTQDYKKNDILGPIQTEDGYYMFLKIKRWTDTPAITEKQREDRLNKIRNTYEQNESKKEFEKYIRKIMKGKQIVFNKDVFFHFADIMGPIYMMTEAEKEDAFKIGAWNTNIEEVKHLNSRQGLNEIRKELLFTINGKKWTVEKCMEEIKKHPLVFRTKKFSKDEFGYQLQLAIMDMIRDKFLTIEAYANGYDKAPEVINDDAMWRDNLIVLNEKYNILAKTGEDSIFNVNYQQVLEKTLNPMIDSLQKKYSSRILINTKLFNSIKLTRIDMAVNYNDAPFPQVVPGFPIITTDNKLDYGRRMK